MRTREEIENEARFGTQEATQDAILEVLLDIRELNAWAKERLEEQQQAQVNAEVLSDPRVDCLHYRTACTVCGEVFDPARYAGADDFDIVYSVPGLSGMTPEQVTEFFKAAGLKEAVIEEPPTPNGE